MRILHTADWHLGARLVERDRLNEHSRFLDWLIEVIRHESIDALLISGDVFDSANPPQDAVGLYFDFLKRLTDFKSIHTVITAGNHDSASHLNAPRELLKKFGVHVFGHAGNHLVDVGEAIVVATPYLRERDLRQSQAGETLQEAHEQVRTAIAHHYSTQRHLALEAANKRPVIAMGHLTVLGAKTSDSEREIHIGNLGAVGADIFEGFNYTALGHLHRPQCVAGLSHVRYSGSPIPLSFSEVGDAKSVVVLDTQNSKVDLQPIPLTQPLVRATIQRENMKAQMANISDGSWTEITVNLDVPEPDLDRQVREASAGRFEVLKVIVELPPEKESVWTQASPALDELQPRVVFAELLKEKNLTDPDLSTVFDELLSVHEAAATL